MHRDKDKVVFSDMIELSLNNIQNAPIDPGLYMICKKDHTDNNQVVFAGLGNSLKKDLLDYLKINNCSNQFYFCYTQTTYNKINNQSKLYERVA